VNVHKVWLCSFIRKDAALYFSTVLTVYFLFHCWYFIVNYVYICVWCLGCRHNVQLLESFVWAVVRWQELWDIFTVQALHCEADHCIMSTLPVRYAHGTELYVSSLLASSLMVIWFHQVAFGKTFLLAANCTICWLFLRYLYHSTVCLHRCCLSQWISVCGITEIVNNLAIVTGFTIACLTVSLSVCLSDCMSNTLMHPAKAITCNEVPFGRDIPKASNNVWFHT